MNVVQMRRVFEKANRNRGLEREQLLQFSRIASRYDQAALNFILPLLARNGVSKVKAVITAARAALKGPDFTDGVHDIFATAHVPGFPIPDAVVGYDWILEACYFACENYQTPSPATEAPVPVLQ